MEDDRFVAIEIGIDEMQMKIQGRRRGDEAVVDASSAAITLRPDDRIAAIQRPRSSDSPTSRAVFCKTRSS
jgi:hypothetical protein